MIFLCEDPRCESRVRRLLPRLPPVTGEPIRIQTARRLRDRQDDYLRFTTDFRAPPDNDLASHCTSWVRSAVSGFSRWSGRVAGVVLSIACGTDIFRQRAAEVGVVAAS